MRRIALPLFLLATATPAFADIALPLTVRGNEPFWSLTLTPDRFTYTDAEGTTLDGPATAAATDKGAWLYDTPAGPLTVTAAICRDSMSGMPHPFTATLARDGRDLPACAGNPADLLDGDWTATTLNGAPLPAGVTVTLSFAGGRISGTSGCNRFTGTAALTGEGLSIGQIAATKMACPPPLMETEQAVFAALAAVAAFDIDADGSLRLATPDGTALIGAAR